MEKLPVADGAGDVTRLLGRWRDGDPAAAEPLLGLVYDDLRRAAHGFARGERVDHTLDPTAVVHEAWMRLAGEGGAARAAVEWQSREHFLGVAARVMRRVLVDHARRRSRDKRGGDRRRVPLGGRNAAGPSGPDDAWLLHLEIDRALSALARFAPLDARVVEARFYAGMTLEQTAELVGVSRRTVVRAWRRARAWLRAELAAPGADR